MKHVKHNPLALAIGVALLIGAILVAVFIWYPSTQPGTVATTVYYATSPLSAGTQVTSGILQPETLDLPPGFANAYLNPTDLASVSSQQLLVAVAPNTLIPLTDFAPSLTTKQSGIEIAFKNSPPLAAGDVVDIYITSQGVNGNAEVQVLLHNITLQPGGGADWMISVPTSIASAVLYASSNGNLSATLVVAGNKQPTPPPITSLSQALQIIQRSGAS